MKYIITGSLGHISNPIVTALVKEGHNVTVISSNKTKAGEIESLGAKAAIGSITDRSFVTNTFKGADVVYLMIPPNFAAPDFRAYQHEVADNYTAAIKQNNIQRVVLLSSIGAHLRKGAGPIDGLAYLEEQLLSLNINAKFLRPGYFYYNIYHMAGMLKHAGFIGGNFGTPEEKLVLVHHLDIAAKAIEHLKNPSFTGYSVDYIVSDERYASDIATVIGNSVGKPGAQWVTFTDQQALDGMLQQGINADLAENYKDMGKAFREGHIQEDYWKNKPAQPGSHKLEDFAKEFAAVYAQQP
ncbi:MAG TPA: NAD(P)H-binding protein [Chitinophagaceae bacterium]|jgi:uncharacterized protein YbjT (DUF2867 family)|nr:NAD(P)H-binding protein [Chitinophagaceae bacterium]